MSTMPNIFFGHGNPLNALNRNPYAEAWERMGREIPSRNHQPLIDYESLGHDALLSAPTPDHYLPLLYVMALQRDSDAVTFPVEGVDGGSISMLTVHVG